MAPKAKPKTSVAAKPVAKAGGSKKPPGKRSPPPSPPPLVVPPGPPTGALGSLLRYRGGTWRVVYSGPVLHREGRHVGLELQPPPRLAATFVPSSPADAAGVGASEAQRRRTANAEAVAQALLMSIQRQYEGTGGRTDRDVALDDAESETLALADCMRDACARHGGFTDGVSPDGITRYFTPSSTNAWAVLVPWDDVVSDQTAFEARRALRLDVLQALAGPPELARASSSAGLRTPNRIRSGTGSDDEATDAAGGLPQASSSPLVVGSTASLIRRSQHRASRDGSVLRPDGRVSSAPAASASDAGDRFVDAGETEAVVRSARGRARESSVVFNDAPSTPTGDGDGDLCGWGGGTAGDPTADDGSSTNGMSPMRIHDTAGPSNDDDDDVGGDPMAASPSPALPSASRQQAVANGQTTGRGPSERDEPRHAGLPARGREVPTVSTGTQTLHDPTLGWIRSLSLAGDANSNPSATDDVANRTAALETFSDAVASALAELRRSLSTTLTDGLLDTVATRWSADFAALQKLAMRPPAPHPPVPGALLTSGSLDFVGSAADGTVTPPSGDAAMSASAVDDPILHEAIAAEEQRDIDTVISDAEMAVASLEAELEDAERGLLRELTDRPRSPVESPPPGPEDVDAEDATPAFDVTASGHYAALRRIARRLAAARVRARRCCTWLPSSRSSSQDGQSSFDLTPLKAQDEEVDDLLGVFSALETSAGTALRPLLSFLARRAADEPLLAAAVEEDELVREAVARLRFDAESEADRAKACEADGDVEEYERHALDRLSLLEGAQEHVAKACEKLYAPLSRTLLEVPKATLKQVTSATTNALVRLDSTLDTGIRAARQSRSDALATLDTDTSAFIRASYGVAREVAEHKRAIDALNETRREAVAAVLEQLKRLHEGSVEIAERTNAVSQLFHKRASLLDEYEERKTVSTRRIYHAHREVLSLRCVAAAMADIRKEQADALEAETARIMAMQREVTERSMALHELHHSTHRDVSLAAGEIQFRKSALQRRIEDRCDTVKAKLYLAQESSANDDETRALAAARTELEGLSSAIGDTIAELDSIVDRSSASYRALSAPPLITAGRELADPRDEILEMNAARQAKIEAYQSDVLRITDGPRATQALSSTAAGDSTTKDGGGDVPGPVSTPPRASPTARADSAGTLPASPAAVVADAGDDADAALARGLAEAQEVVRAAELPHTEGYNPFHSTADPHDPTALD